VLEYYRMERTARRTFVGSCVKAALSLAVLLAGSMSAHAAIDFYRLGKRIAYHQTSDSQPTTPVGFDGGFDLYATSPAELTSARVFSTSPILLSPTSPFTLSEYAPGSWALGQFYDSLESMDTNLPPGDTFGYLIEGGSMGNRLALLRAPATNLFTADVPYFTNNAFSQLNDLDPTDSFTFTWSGFTPEVGITDAPIFFTIYRVSDGQSMIGTVVENSVTSFLIPANTLAAATQYRAELYYSSRLNTVDAGFVDADSSVTFDLVTNLDFTTGAGAGSSAPVVPEPTIATLALSGLIMIVMMSRARHRVSCCCLVFVVSLGDYSSPAEAAIDFYRVGKTMVYQQTSASQPTTPSSIYGGVDLASQSPADLTSARVFSTTTMPPSPVPEFILIQFLPGYWGTSQGYASLAEMDTDLPPGDTFGFLIEGGALGAQLALLPLPATDLFAPDVPYLTGSTFSRLNGMDPTAPVNVTWNSFTPLPGVTEAPIFFGIYRVSDGQQIVGTGLSSSATSFEIPAGTLAANTAYRAVLNFSSRANTLDSGFLTADGSNLFDVISEVNFTSGARLPGDYNRDDRVDAADYVVWRKTLGQMNVTPYSGADGDGDGDILLADLGVWKANFGMTAGSGSGSHASAVPEPASALYGTSWLIAILGLNRPRGR
jgi:hypothetical protein